MKPSVGRIVHYYPPYAVANEEIAAIVTAVRADTVSLTIFPARDDCVVDTAPWVPFAEAPPTSRVFASCWCWPPRSPS